MQHNDSSNKQGYSFSEIYYTMERMGSAATETDAIEMLVILNSNGMSAAHISDLSEDCWLTLCRYVAALNSFNM